MKFTVGIAAYNEEKTLPKTIPLMLEHLGKNHLIISACGSDTIRIANELAKKDERIIIIEEHKREGKAAALNKILKAAKTEVIILTDADVIPEKGSFELISEHFKKPNIGYVSGRAIALNNDKSVFTFYANFSYGTMHELRLKCHKLPTGYLFGIRKSSVSPIPDCHSEDALIGTMISSNGYEFVYEPKAVVKVVGGVMAVNPVAYVCPVCMSTKGSFISSSIAFNILTNSFEICSSYFVSISFISCNIFCLLSSER